jgi:DNA-binding MarR family transcriptional regulator
LTSTASGPLIGALLRRPFLAARRQIHTDLASHGFEDVHPAHLSVFQYPGPDDRRPIELAESAQMTKQAMNHLLGQLVELGYLVREAGAQGTRVRLTARGRALQRAIRESVLRIEERWRDSLGAARYQRLRELLGDLNASLEGGADLQ